MCMISKGNHVKFARFVLLAVSEETKTLFFRSMYNKTIIDSGFVISRIIKVSVRDISLSLRLRLITLTSTLIILDITKTESNNSNWRMFKNLPRNPSQTSLTLVTLVSFGFAAISLVFFLSKELLLLKSMVTCCYRGNPCSRLFARMRLSSIMVPGYA